LLRVVLRERSVLNREVGAGDLLDDVGEFPDGDLCGVPDVDGVRVIGAEETQ
jgi:hypothetical protein